jgi:hypothetical protein
MSILFGEGFAAAIRRLRGKGVNLKLWKVNPFSLSAIRQSGGEIPLQNGGFNFS